MTDDERQMLEDTHTKADLLYRAFMEVPPGSPKDEKTLLEWNRVLVKGAQRASWAGRMLVIVATVITTLGAAAAYLGSWVDFGKGAAGP